MALGAIGPCVSDEGRNESGTAKGDPHTERKARLAANLRANLRRRKAQARELDGDKSAD